jgi:hypothetical protein
MSYSSSKVAYIQEVSAVWKMSERIKSVSNYKKIIKN